MNSAYLLAICASILLLQLEVAATTAKVDEVGLRELWRSRQPLVIRNPSPTGVLITVTYNLSPDGISLSRRKVTEGPLPAILEDNSRAKPQEDWEIEYRPRLVPGTKSAGEVTRLVFEITPDGKELLRKRKDEARYPIARVPERHDIPPVTDNQRQTTLKGTEGFYNSILTSVKYIKNLWRNVVKLFTPNECRPMNVPAEEQPKLDEGDPDNVPEQNLIGNPTQPGVPHKTKPIWYPETDKPSLLNLVPKDDDIDTAIDEYLAAHRITVADIEEEDGELVKTIVDKQGRVLSVSFKLGKGRNDQPS
ncbi:uncharacterized protein LOC108090010 [Drosophila ficusphila]|uniref:uncharacterized protein LOC108090010 n=1 Tax=Drosophila ficusphila TaxID=30025 RepID=UPI001C895918|nr:uncharacterized protein LOC108090010 [Drosophila ficusphila]